MGPLGGFWPKLGRKRVTGWKQRSCVPPGRVKTNKQTNVFPGYFVPLQVRPYTEAFKRAGTTKASPLFEKILKQQIKAGGANKIMIYTSMDFVNADTSVYFHIGAPYTLPNPSKFDIVLHENGTADISLIQEAVAHIKRHTPLENMENLSVYARYVGLKHEPHCWVREDQDSNVLLSPWKTDRAEIEHFAGCPIKNYWMACEKFKAYEHLLVAKELSLPAKVLLYRMHMRHNDAFKSLASYFFLKSQIPCQELFWQMACIDYQTGLRIPRFWTTPAAAATENDEEKCAIFEEILNMGSPFSKRLASYFEDPKGLGRKPVVLNIDSMKLQVQKSSDFDHQKKTYTGYKTSKSLNKTENPYSPYPRAFY
jgi:hypothetical protein